MVQTTYRLTADLAADLDEFQRQVQRFKSGAISAAELRSFRVPRGVYEQRESDTYMLRVRFPAGAVLPAQMRALAAVARQYGNGILHFTTRQDIQVHRVLLDDIHPALVALHAAGLSTKGGGGNTVRNITACCDAGVCPRELFDVSPYVVALTEFLLPDPLSYQLPRKYKIAFAGCPRDCPGVRTNDVGFLAQRRNGALGFTVYVGGGMGASSRVGDLLEEWVPVDEVNVVAEAVKRVFDQHGNRRNRQRARLRFLVAEIGLARFRELYERELATLRATAPPLTIRDLASEGASTGGDIPCDRTPGEEFATWRRRYVVPQKQPGYFLVHVPLVLGDIAAERLEELADVVEQFGEGTARTTQQQGLVLRRVAEHALQELYARLSALGLARADAPVLSNLVACAGASTCRLGMCLSRGLAAAIHDTLAAGAGNLDALGVLKIHISGCPNACGRHPVADIGLFGAARRVQGRLVPHYVLQLGGAVGEGRTELAEGTQTIPARNVPALVVELLDAFSHSKACPDFGGFLRAEGRMLAEALARRFAAVPDFAQNKDYYFDWGAKEMFSLAGRGPGECGAGVFDLIEVDLESARDALGQGRLFEATVLAARALLVTRGQQAHDAAEALALFAEHFVAEKLIDGSYSPLIALARQAAAAPQPDSAFAVEAAEVSRFVAAIQGLYDGMDSSLRFKPATGEPAAAAAPVAEVPAAADREADFRGVVCPLNYVRTKLLLGQMAQGKVLSVLLDAAGARSVPESVEKDGHEVLSVAEQGEHWRVLIRKA